MTNQLVTLPPPSQLMQKARTQRGSINSNLTEGVAESFPVLSIRGSKFSVRFQGVETPNRSPQGLPQAYVDVVIIEASKNITKTFYKAGYNPGDMKPPDCWSMDGVKPHPSVSDKQNPTCPGCIQNVWGSSIAQDGSQRRGKACSDNRRVAVLLPPHLLNGEFIPTLLRIPPTSLKPLKQYADELSSAGYDANMVETRLSFTNDAHPVLTFEAVKTLSDSDYEMVLDFANDERTTRMLASPVDGITADVTDEEMQQALMTTRQPEPAPTQYASFTQPEAQQPQPPQPTPPQPQPIPPQPEEPAPKPLPPAAQAPSAHQIFTMPDGTRINTVTGERLPPLPPMEIEPEPEVDRTGWVAVQGMPGVFFSPQAQGLVDEQGNPYSPGAPQKAPPAPAKAPPAASAPVEGEILLPGQKDPPASFFGGSAPQQAAAGVPAETRKRVNRPKKAEAEPAASQANGPDPAAAVAAAPAGLDAILAELKTSG